MISGATYKRWLVVLAVVTTTGGVLIPRSASGQSSATLDSRIQPPLRAAVQALLDSASAAGIPAAPLADKALEGVSKGADPAKILAAVRTFRDQLRQAQETLGSASTQELVAAVTALRAGAPPATLKAMQQALPKRSLVIPYAVVSSMIRQGVSVNDATSAVINQAKRADDQRLVALSSEVERNIAAGLPARTALIRAEGMLLGTGGTDRANGSTRP